MAEPSHPIKQFRPALPNAKQWLEYGTRWAFAAQSNAGCQPPQELVEKVLCQHPVTDMDLAMISPYMTPEDGILDAPSLRQVRCYKGTKIPHAFSEHERAMFAAGSWTWAYNNYYALVYGNKHRQHITDRANCGLTYCLANDTKYPTFLKYETVTAANGQLYVAATI